LTIYILQRIMLRRSGLVVTTLLLIFLSMCQWKNSEKRSIFGDDMDKSVRLTTFLGGHVVYAT